MALSLVTTEKGELKLKNGDLVLEDDKGFYVLRNRLKEETKQLAAFKDAQEALVLLRVKFCLWLNELGLLHEDFSLRQEGSCIKIIYSGG